MGEQTLKFGDIVVNKEEFHASKQAIALNLVDINKIVVSEKFKFKDKGFKYFIGCKDDNIVRPLCIILPQMSGYIKHNKICNNVKKTLNIKFHSMPVYDENT